MANYTAEEKIKISNKSQDKLNLILEENPRLKEILLNSEDEIQVNKSLKIWAVSELRNNKLAYKYYRKEVSGRKAFEKIKWQEIAAIRILDYIDYTNQEYTDLNVRGQKRINTPFKILWLAAKYGIGGGKYFFFDDMHELFSQFSGRKKHKYPSKEQIEQWMCNHPSGLDSDIVIKRQKNKDRIINIIIELIDSEKIKSTRYTFEEGLSVEGKIKLVNEWWNNKHFHLKFAIRNPDLLNRMLDESLDSETMSILKEAEKQGIPFFVNPYYLSLLDTDKRKRNHADAAIRDYIIYSKELVHEFGHIVAWEKEDIVEPDKPNTAGWLLPNAHSIHRRYPEVAILIPDSVGRACGGLCASCQRMYDFQSGNLNFNLKALEPNENWPAKLDRLMSYFENDTQLRDILITGGDALMSSDKSLINILDAVYEMAYRKKEKNKTLEDGKKYAEMMRVRLGTRLPVYLPQRITAELIKILTDFKEKASKLGIHQFVIQTHFESAMEITPEVTIAIDNIIKAGWTITNQHVFTAASSRRGHTNKLRKVLNDIGVITYYTFSVKGYMENYNNFANNARAVQEQLEEKRIGKIPQKYIELLKTYQLNASNIKDNINYLREQENLPFLATDRNVINLPGVGKSLTFRTIGITRRGRRILKFDHDSTRIHSPIINEMDDVIIVESKPIGEYLRQLKQFGENQDDYCTIWGYSIGETERRFPVFEYPKYTYENTSEFSNLKL
ncbi:MAG: KamA family protein [Bacteroidales bacterium]|jgi:lysine 2,3-aminomutase|nr:KamA family protein [Bacteroidales bacterium]